jgi:hypothetical protein
MRPTAFLLGDTRHENPDRAAAPTTIVTHMNGQAIFDLLGYPLLVTTEANYRERQRTAV